MGMRDPVALAGYGKIGIKKYNSIMRIRIIDIFKAALGLGLIPAAVMLSVIDARAQISGSWEGKLSVTPQASLRLVLNFTKDSEGKTSVTLDSPDQNAYGIPAEAGYISADSVSVSMPKLMASYSGRLKDGELKGKFAQGPMSFPLDLKPAKKLNRPQTPEAPFPYAEKEVSFTQNVYDDYALTGTLTLPAGYNKNTPAVVMVTGSGTHNRDEEILGHRPFAVIADYLARNGIASLRYDDRGYDNGGGGVSAATSETFARDAGAALGLLRKEGFKKAGILGHSEGGMIAFMLAGGRLNADGKDFNEKNANDESACSKNDKETLPDFIVTLGAPAVRGDSLLLDQNRALLEGNMDKETIEAYIKALGAVYDIKIASGNEAASEVLDSLCASWPSTSVYARLKANLKNIASDRNPWLNYFIKYSPAESIMETKCPALALYGEKDLQVRPSLNAVEMRRLNQGVDVMVYPRLNHLFQHALTGSPTEYGQIEETISEEVLADMVEFIKKLK